MSTKMEFKHHAPIDLGNPKDDDDRHHDHEHDIIGYDHEMESFHTIGKGAPKINDSTEKKLCWLRSQIIGGSAEFDTPFGRRRLTYADHTASGRSLRCIENYISTNVLPFYGNSHTSDSHVGYRTTKMMHEATHYVKKCLGGGEEDAIIFCGSGSTAAIKRLQEVMGIAVPSILRERVLGCLSEQERWVVLVGPYEHHSNILSWRQSLAEVVEIGLDHRGGIDMEGLRKELSLCKTTNRPILGSFSACSNVTGVCINTRLIARLLHQFGALACFDFAASGPYTKIKMRRGEMEMEGYDAIFLSTHKFVGGPGTPGILVMNKVLYRLASSPPSTCGGGTVTYVNNFNEKVSGKYIWSDNGIMISAFISSSTVGMDTVYVDNIEEREEAGTPQIIQKIRAAMAFWVKEYIAYKAIGKVEKSYIQRALQRLLPNPKVSILGNTDVKRQAILSFLVYSAADFPLSSTSTSTKKITSVRDKPLHGAFVAKLLNDLFGIQARGGCACAGPYGHSLLNIDRHQSLALRSLIQKGYVGIKPGWTRVSFPYYMSEEEFDFILEGIEFIGTYGQKFLWCYDFDWRTGSWSFKNNIKELKDHHGSSLVRVLKVLNMKQDVVRYRYYLETAKRIATLLPKYSPHRKPPKEIDVHLLPFTF